MFKKKFILLIIFFIFSFFLIKFINNFNRFVINPSLIGVSYNEAYDLLKKRNLKLEIKSNFLYSSNYMSLVILKQSPKSGLKIRENRKVYLMLNIISLSKIRMPELISKSVQNAKIILQNYNLIIGKTRYIPNVAKNIVLQQFYKEKNIKKNIFILKGSKIDLLVGSGFNSIYIKIPQLKGMQIEKVDLFLLKSRLRAGSVVYNLIDILNPNIIFNQFPNNDRNIKIKNVVDLWASAFNKKLNYLSFFIPIILNNKI